MKLALPKKLKKKHIMLIVSALALVLFLMWSLGVFRRGSAPATAAELEPYTVSRGDISVSVTGSGTVEPIEQYEIQSIVTGDIIEDYVTLGSKVNKDDILYVIDSSAAENNLKRSENSYQQELISHNNKLKDASKASVYIPFDGVITEMYVKQGDSVSVGTKLAEIKNTTSLTVRVPFLAANAKNLYLNQAATVYFDNRNETVSGYVSHIATGTYATNAGAVVSDVEITIKNPGAILAGEEVTATVGSYACNDSGKVEEASSKTITAETSGDISYLAYGKGDNVKSGALMLKISDDNTSTQLRSSQISLENSKLSLDDMREKLEDYTLRSPISGTIISKTMKGGDTLDGNKSSLAIVADMSKLTFDISVDELDIKNIAVGQNVKVTADAIPDSEFTGVVDKISIIGTSTNGVTVYPVTVVISEYDGLLPGMNVNAEILTSEAKDVLTVPVNAVTRGNLVLVKDDSQKPTAEDAEDKEKDKDKDKESSRDGKRLPDAPEGYKYVQVEIGMSSDDYVEIKSGLSEGDEIYVSVIKSTGNEEESNMFTGMHPGGGGMPSGGGMSGPPSGNMPSDRGGMPSGGMGSGGGMR